MKSALASLTVAGLLAGGLSACGGSASAPSAAPAAPATPAGSSSPAPSGPPAALPSLTARQIADAGLPSRLGAGKLSTTSIKRLVQFFEDKVSRAYATGKPDELSHYLAGPMLSGNRATIELLDRQHRRNVFRIHVQSVKPETNEARHVIVQMTGDMTVDYFFDPRTHKVLEHGLPGPSQVQFTIFLDQNPATHTWYWTGAQSGSSGSPTGAQVVQ